MGETAAARRRAPREEATQQAPGPRINLLGPRPAGGTVYRAEWAPECDPANLPPGSLAERRFALLLLRALLPDWVAERAIRARALWRARDGRDAKRSLGQCEACLWEPGPHGRALHVHHVRPLRLGANHRPPNLMALCARCHGIAHSLFGNDDPGSSLRLRLCILVAISALEDGSAMSRAEIIAAVDDVEREIAAEHMCDGGGI